MYPKDCWYVAAWADEISGKPLGRILLNEPVVLLRDPEGAVHALEDRCCHRKVRLSGGKMLGDRLQCPYHGMEFDFNGICVRVPGQPGVPAGARIKKYVVVEKWKLIWIWMGDPDRADVSSIPDWWQLDHPEWTFPKGNVLHVNCNYQLLIDNILDQSHANYVHVATLGTQEANDVPASISKIADGVRCTSWVFGCPPAPFHTKFGVTATTVDRWHISEAVLPCYVLIELGTAPAGTGAEQGNRSEALVLRAFNAAVPETATTSHKFFAHARQFKLDSPEIDEVFATRFVKVSLEDNEILEEQQKMVDLDPGNFRVDIGADAAGLQFRKLLKRQIDACA